MKEMVRFGLMLMIVSVVAAASLAAVYNVTKPRIEEQKRVQFETALSNALPGSEKVAIEPVKKDQTVLYFKGYKDNGKAQFLGYAFRASSYGYSSPIESLVGVDSMGTIVGLKILSQAETPGLGTKVQEIRYGEKEPWFTRQFIGKNAARVAVTNDGGEIVTITGATVSSRTVVRAVVQGYKNLSSNLQQ